MLGSDNWARKTHRKDPPHKNGKAPRTPAIGMYGACAFSFRPRLEITDGTRNQASVAVSSGMPGPIVEVMVALVM